jgi:hypothetical protein
MGEARAMSCQQPLTYIAKPPLSLRFDADTGILWVAVIAGFEYLNPSSGEKEEFHQPLRLGLAKEVSQSLLADLPKLEALLQQASKS